MPRAKSKKSEETKRRIMEAARCLFEQRGFDSVPVREIAEAAGVAKGTFYLYFETKFDVLKAYAGQFIEKFQLIAHRFLKPEVEDYAEQVGVIVDGLLRVLEQNRSWMIFFHRADMVKLLWESNLHELFERVFIEPVAGFLESGMRAGQFRRLDTQLYAKLFIMICHQLLENAILYNYPESADKVRDALKDSIIRILQP